ncbi:NACHT domain-containing protein [Rhodoferax sp. TBRC 17660]|uniref:NACHT domain-containing protein n=1 Tax=Rhodoferax potami TaxID=3068338 RepID=A0ABU3KKF2_9BURK|nr:NACHT domain-containing protein [Rhodoferax sp. TBRC 17660]MDT7517843.1 NACHT domain-containing protein [Rhodoferax sp. TBRC 17660]
MQIDPETALAAFETLKSTLGIIADKAKPKVKEQLLKWKAPDLAEKLQENIRQIGKITTIASREASTIDEIYYPSRIKLGKSGSRVIAFASELVTGNSRVTLIIGTAGQGKSVFLRYLCLRDLDVQGNLPLFVELRKIDENKTLNSLLHEHLVSLGIGEEDPEEVLKALLKSGKAKIFLDGYDEISREYSLRTKAEITRLIRNYDKVNILITSRPGAISQHLGDSFEIHQCEVAPISPNEHDEFFQRIGVPLETKQRLLGAIGRSRAEIKILLSTPLMLTLLVKTCGAQQDLPDTLPEFYDSLFNVLASTHDGTKPGYVRQKATELGNTDLEMLFCAFSFASKELFKKNSLSQRQLEESFTNATRISDVRCSIEGFKTDVTETICLMVRDGLDTAFIHKSIQEYYAARFIHTLEDKEKAREILESIGTGSIFEWSSELQFLEDFKDKSFENVIGIPHAASLLDELCLKKKQRTVSGQKLIRFLRGFDISIGRSKETKEIRTASWSYHHKSSPTNRYYAELMSAIVHEVMSSASKSSRVDSMSDTLEIIKLADLLKSDLRLAQNAVLAVQRYCEKLERRMNAMKDRQIRKSAGLIALLSRPTMSTS